DHSLRHQRRASERMRPATGDPERVEAVHAEMVGDRAYVSRAVGNCPAWMPVATCVPGPGIAHMTDAPGRPELHERREHVSRGWSAVVKDYGLAVIGTEHLEVEYSTASGIYPSCRHETTIAAGGRERRG